MKIDELSPLTKEQLRSQAVLGTRAGVNLPVEPNCSVWMGRARPQLSLKMLLVKMPGPMTRQATR